MFTELAGEIDNYIIALEALERTGGTGGTTQEQKLCKDMLKHVAAHAGEYDVTTSLSQPNWGRSFRGIVGGRATSPDAVSTILQFLAMAAREHTVKRGIEPRPPEAAALQYFSPENPQLDSKSKGLADYLWHGFSRDIVKEMISRHIELQKDFESRFSTQFEARISSWEKSLTEWAQKVKTHESALQNLHQRYNFVALSRAFSQMFQSKRHEKNLILSLVIAFGVLLTLPLLAQLPVGQRTLGLGSLTVEWTTDNWIKAIPLAALEIVLLYFFRIFLRNYYSTKAQLLQLDVRQALCAFVESYVQFIKEKGLMPKDGYPLAGFDAVVFSTLTTDPGHMPASFEGFEHFIKAAKEIRKT